MPPPLDERRALTAAGAFCRALRRSRRAAAARPAAAERSRGLCKAPFGHTLRAQNREIAVVAARIAQKVGFDRREAVMGVDEFLDEVEVGGSNFLVKTNKII